MPSATYTSLDAILKQLYPNGEVPKDAAYTESAFYGMLKKNTKFGGNAVKIPIRYRGGANVARTVSASRTNANNAGYKAFLIPATAKVTRFAMAKWDRQAMKATQVARDKGAFKDAVKGEVEATTGACGQAIGRMLWDNGGDTLGQISATSNTGTPTITLARKEQVANFEEGMVVLAATADPGVSGSGTVRVGSATITGVDEEAGTLTITGNWTASITAVAGNDFLFPLEAIDAGAYSVGGYGHRGVASWIPDTAPGGTDNFYGVPRFQQVTRLSGSRKNLPGFGISEVAQKMGEQLKFVGQRATHLWLSPLNWNRLLNETSSKEVYTVYPQDKGKKMNVGYKAFSFTTACGEVEVMMDRYIRSDRLYLLNMDAWTLWSTGDAISIANEDGQDFRLAENSNDYEQRMVIDMVLACDLPAANCVGIITAAA